MNARPYFTFLLFLYFNDFSLVVGNVNVKYFLDELATIYIDDILIFKGFFLSFHPPTAISCDQHKQTKLASGVILIVNLFVGTVG